MMSVPQKDWSILPATAGGRIVCPCAKQPRALPELRKRGIIPDTLRRDSVDWATPAGGP